ncbi:MAG: Fe-S-containing protein [Oscillospiraceae bacterium]
MASNLKHIKLQIGGMTCTHCQSRIGQRLRATGGDALVRKNCGNHCTVDQVEIESGGCNPWPIFAGNMRVTDETATIGHDYLKQAAQLFANWKSAF